MLLSVRVKSVCTPGTVDVLPVMPGMLGVKATPMFCALGLDISSSALEKEDMTFLKKLWHGSRFCAKPKSLNLPVSRICSTRVSTVRLEL